MRRSRTSAGIVVTFELASDLGSGPVEQDTLVGVGNFEGVADLGCGPAEKVTHGDDLALVRWESIDGPTDRFERFGVECALSGASPWMRWPFPLAARVLRDASESSWIDGGFVVEGGGRREWDGATLLDAA
jgi:hypothetical protein